MLDDQWCDVLDDVTNGVQSVFTALTMECDGICRQSNVLVSLGKDVLDIDI